MIYRVNPYEPAPEPKPEPAPQTKLISALILAGATIGFIMAQQSTSLLRGTGTLWAGFALAAASSVAATVLKDFVPKGVRVIAALAAVISLVSVLSIEHQMEEKRQEISEIFNG